LNVELSAADIQKRLATWKPLPPRYTSGVMPSTLCWFLLLLSAQSLSFLLPFQERLNLF